MKFLRKFNENISIYDKSWQSLLPNEIIVIKGNDKHKFIKGNTMLHSDMLQITYDNNEIDHPNTLEIDIYFVKLNDKISGDGTIIKKFGSISKIEPNYTGLLRLDIDITYGDLVACEFSIDKKEGVKVIQTTTYHSKFDTSNTVFAFDDDSLKKFVEFLNRFNHSVKLSISDFKFLDRYDNY